MAYIQKTNFLHLGDLVADMVDELKLLGFTEVFSSLPSANDKTISFTLQSPTSFDLSDQPWRIKFLGKAESSTASNAKVLSVMAGTDLQLPNDGSHAIEIDYYASYFNGTTTSFWGKDLSGHIASFPWGMHTTWGSAPTQNEYLPNLYWNVRASFFYSRIEFGEDGESNSTDTGAYASAPMTYVISYTSRGLFVGIWNSDTPETGLRFSWFLIQRSVNRSNGQVRGTTVDTADSRCPLFCVFGQEISYIDPVNLNNYNGAGVLTPGNAYGCFTVREKDIKVPGPKYIFTEQSYGSALQNVRYYPSSTNPNSWQNIGTIGDPLGIVAPVFSDREDCPIFLNPCKQVSFSEDGNYMVTFISDLVSNKFKYPDELDMVATISADLIGLGQELEFTVYGEALPRKYIALANNGAFGTGMRLLVLKSNPNE